VAATARRHQVRAGLGAEPRAAAPDGHRPGGDGAAGDGGRLSGCDRGCTGGGSNFAGIAFPFIGAQDARGKKTRIVAVEPAACPSLTRGQYAYDFGDTGAPDAADEDAHAGVDVHAAGLPCRRAALSRHGAAGEPREAVGPDRSGGLPPDGCSRRGEFARAEGIMPAPEANHAVKGAIDEALKCKRGGRRAPSCSTSAATATSTCRPTSTTSRASSPTRNTTRTELAMALAGCRR
jgi:tryptophan synthase beta chain